MEISAERTTEENRTAINIGRNLDSCSDNKPTLLVSLQKSFDRLQISAEEIYKRELGKKLNHDKVHPHKFRRTLTTMAIDKGMPIVQVQQLLIHYDESDKREAFSPKVYWMKYLKNGRKKWKRKLYFFRIGGMRDLLFVP